MDVGRILLYLVALACCSDCLPEPLCSKFSYQEQLLEKLVRMELRMENMEKEIKKTQMKTNEKISAVEEFEEKRDVDTDIKFARLNETIFSLSEQMKNKISTQGPTIAFHAHFVANKKPDKYEVIVFQNVMLNEGEAYDSSSGYFTAPVSGLYHFTTHLCVYPDLALMYVVMVEDERWASGYYKSKNIGTCASVSATVKIQEGQRAWVTQDEYSSPSKLLYEDDNDWNHFSGFLVKQL